MSSVLLGGPPQTATANQSAQPSPSAPGQTPPGFPPPGSGEDTSGRGNAVTVIAGVGVLLLAMGIGVLIGRSGATKQAATPAPQVITVSSGAATGGASGTQEATFSDDWPAGGSGYTVQLQKLPSAGTQTSAVEAAKTAATAKGASAVGALKSEDFSSLTAGSYIVYSGEYHKQAEAEKALKGLKKKFPGASVIHVANGAATSKSSTSAGGAGSGKSGVGASESHPAPPSVVESLKYTKGKSYEEKSKNLPDVISTG